IGAGAPEVAPALRGDHLPRLIDGFTAAPDAYDVAAGVGQRERHLATEAAAGAGLMMAACPLRSNWSRMLICPLLPAGSTRVAAQTVGPSVVVMSSMTGAGPRASAPAARRDAVRGSRSGRRATRALPSAPAPGYGCASLPWRARRASARPSRPPAAASYA